MVQTTVSVSKKKPGDLITSVKRALSILELLADHPAGLNPKQITHKLQLNLSTCYHQLNTLMATGYVIKNAESALFQLSSKIGYTVHGNASPAQVVKQLTPHVHSLQEATQETSYLSIWDQREIYVAAIIESPQSVRVKVLTIGYNEANHAMALGKAILAYLGPADCHTYLSTHPLPAYTENTMTSIVDIEDHLHQVRRQGYSLDLGERFAEVHCIGAPIFDAQNEVVASIAITLPITRFHAQFDQLVACVQQAAEAATRTLSILGYATNGYDDPDFGTSGNHL